MAWTKKISSVIKGRINSGASSAKGFIDNMAGNLTGEIDTVSYTHLRAHET